MTVASLAVRRSSSSSSNRKASRLASCAFCSATAIAKRTDEEAEPAIEHLGETARGGSSEDEDSIFTPSANLRSVTPYWEAGFEPSLSDGTSSLAVTISTNGVALKRAC